MFTKNQATQIGLHSIRNLLGEDAQLSLFSDHDVSFAKEFHVNLSGKIDRFGIDLTDIQARVMEGILRGFSETKYLGNLTPKNKKVIQEEKFNGVLPEAYKYIVELPCLKASQSQILDWAEINKSGISNWARAVEAIQELGTKQFCFYYDRLAYTDKGQPLREINGRWKKEEVVTVDTLFSIKEIRDEASGELKYYEITPSPIFLDQRESYFVLIPFGWREEVKRLVGNKKASSYTFRFLLFLRYQYELKRRSAKYKSPYQIKYSTEELAIAIKMPESIYKRKKKRMNEIIDDAFIVAKKLGYLKDFERREYLELLTLNDEKYFNPKDLVISKALEAIGPSQESRSIHEVNALQLFELYHCSRKSLDRFHQNPEGFEKSMQVKCFVDLLCERPVEDIANAIKWSESHKYWGSRLDKPIILRSEFSKLWTEYSLSQKSDGSIIDKNKKFALDELSKFENCQGKTCWVTICNNYVEFMSVGQSRSVTLNYDDKNFVNKVKDAIKIMEKCN